MQTLTEAARGIRNRSVSPTELLRECLRAIHQLDDRLHAWVRVDEEAALARADQLTKEAYCGQFRGPLHGVPVGIKDIIDVAGVPTTAGSALREDHVASEDAPAVRALREAGAIVLGKTVTVEWACFDPSPSRNPWDAELKRSPGGSSSGSAVAVAAGMVPAALGTQTGGSLVRPSAYCGIATCKPTFGRVSRRGVVPVSLHFDHVGPMATCVDDLEQMLACIPQSEEFGPSPNFRWAESPTAGSVAKPSFKLGVPQQFFFEQAQQQLRDVVNQALRNLSAHDETAFSLVDVDLPPNFGRVVELHTTIMAADAAAYHQRAFLTQPEAYGPMISSLLEHGLSLKATDVAAALADQERFRLEASALFRGVDALIMPATDTTAPGLETTGDKKFQCPWSVAGLPVISVPCGVAADGMPVGVQIVGPYHSERHLFALARACEQAFDFSEQPAYYG